MTTSQFGRNPSLKERNQVWRSSGKTEAMRRSTPRMPALTNQSVRMRKLTLGGLNKRGTAETVRCLDARSQEPAPQSPNELDLALEERIPSSHHPKLAARIRNLLRSNRKPTMSSHLWHVVARARKSLGKQIPEPGCMMQALRDFA